MSGILFKAVLIAQLGALPTGPELVESMETVEVEVSLRFWVSPDRMVGLVPDVEDLATVGHYRGPTTTTDGPPSDWVSASLLFISSNAVGVRSPEWEVSDRIAVKASWWVNLVDSVPPPDERARGLQQAIELGSWFSDPVFVSQYRAAGSRVGRADVGVERTTSGWTFWHRSEGGDIEGSCDLVGAPSVEQYTLPAYSTVWQPGVETRAFVVYTFAGHRSQRCALTSLRVSGATWLAQTVREGAEQEMPTVLIMTGWRSEAGLYSTVR